MEKFSVLMSVYAREQSAYLDEALRSVFEQTVPPSEVMLVKEILELTLSGFIR